MSFWFLQFFQKTNLKLIIFALSYRDRDFLVRILEELKKQKVHWKLTDQQTSSEVNRSNLSMFFPLQNFTDIDCTTYVIILWFPWSALQTIIPKSFNLQIFSHYLQSKFNQIKNIAKNIYCGTVDYVQYRIDFLKIAFQLTQYCQVSSLIK